MPAMERDGAGRRDHLAAGELPLRDQQAERRQREVLRESVRAAAGADILAGLALGGGLFIGGTTTGARMTALLRH